MVAHQNANMKWLRRRLYGCGGQLYDYVRPLESGVSSIDGHDYCTVSLVPVVSECMLKTHMASDTVTLITTAGRANQINQINIKLLN